MTHRRFDMKREQYHATDSIKEKWCEPMELPHISKSSRFITWSLIQWKLRPASTRTEVCKMNRFRLRGSALWAQMIRNRRIQFIGISHFPMSSRASELRSALAKRAVRSKQMSERCERMSERWSEWPSTLRVDFIVILPIVCSLTIHANLRLLVWRALRQKTREDSLITTLHD